LALQKSHTLSSSAFLLVDLYFILNGASILWTYASDLMGHQKRYRAHQLWII
jgi:hypothetical protein